MPDGSFVYDGYYPSSATAEAPVPSIGVPVVHIVNECEIVGGLALPGLGYRRADADTSDDMFRLYEMAGSPHTGTRGGIKREHFAIFNDILEPGERLSQYPQAMLRVAALDNLIRWIVDGQAAPYAERIATKENGEVIRDPHGNAMGGVRVSQLDVPIAQYIASAPRSEKKFFRRVVGLEEPFSKDKLVQLYGDRDNYAAQVSDCLEKLVEDRWILRGDADTLLIEAQQTDAFL
jgi:hypothetical protein